MRAQGIRCDMKERKRSEKAPLKVRRFRRVSNVLIVCTLVALVAVTMGAGGAGGVLAMNREDVYYSGRTDTSSVAVMINVYWGEEYLPQILQTLQDAGAKATFISTKTATSWTCRGTCARCAPPTRFCRR